MMTESSLALLRAKYPEIALGESDATAGRWSEVEGVAQSFAYEVGRIFARDPPKPSTLGGFVTLSGEAQGAINELMAFRG